MQNSLSKVLQSLRLKSQSEFEKGEYFEKLVKVFLENDTLQGQSYDKVWLFKDWAKEQGYKANDAGIDLVARHSDGSGFCAIQCKFYASDHSIKKSDIDSFVSAASTKDFVSLVIVDTTIKDFSAYLKAMLENGGNSSTGLLWRTLRKAALIGPLISAKKAFSSKKRKPCVNTSKRHWMPFALGWHMMTAAS